MKKSPQNEDALVQLVEGGLSLTRAAQSLGMHHKTVHRWKADDKEFAGRIQQAEAKFIGKMLSNIADQAQKDWRAGIELLARRFPDEFAKPEARLSVTQVNVDPKPMFTKAETDKFLEDPDFLKAIEDMRERAILRQNEVNAVSGAVV